MPKKILIVEDEEILLDLLKNKLESLGYEVYYALDGEKGLKAIRDIVPDLILLDIIMPKMSGFEVMEAMQKDPSIKDIPVIIISNSGQPVELNKAKQLGAKDWLIKTEFDPVEVLKKVKAVLGEPE